ncbi:hypothetical protein P6144_18295 [Sphingomonas sp. HITSZ_GF]|uniref:hypothetical protein n=1 Tax=Sphingomonas sp. HITSZ_GF TaxID=3037247 RepID=UPI00240E4740|nr:hypothetical protein [Sphingomonas sp. HITSZ_GF]MDG2535618.1 hypothetical protein [Sphingomonas sp. HITSZ_GF]
MKFAVLFACVAFAVPAIAQQATPTPAADAKPEKKICRMVESTGSIMGKRECHTKEEWRQIADANADRAGRALDNRARMGGNGGMSGN